MTMPLHIWTHNGWNFIHKTCIVNPDKISAWWSGSSWSHPYLRSCEQLMTILEDRVAFLQRCGPSETTHVPVPHPYTYRQHLMDPVGINFRENKHDWRERKSISAWSWEGKVERDRGRPGRKGMREWIRSKYYMHVWMLNKILNFKNKIKS